MSINELSASNYQYSEQFYITEFENILSKITICYNMMISDNVKFENNENKIRDVMLLKYLKDEEIKIKLKLSDYLFDREIPENVTDGRVDIRIMPVNPLINDYAYYIIECKRINNDNLKGTSGLNGEYIKCGIYRFVSLQYSLYYRINALIGFVVEKINIDENIDNLNNLLQNNFTNCNTIKFIKRTNYIDGFNFQYDSVHKDINFKEFKLYHLMLDFSNNIN